MMITPGQSMDILITANQSPGIYIMATKSYSGAFGAGFDNTTATAILKHLTTSPNHQLKHFLPHFLHGYSFYVEGWGFGTFDPEIDPKRYNLVDPPEETTVGVPKNG